MTPREGTSTLLVFDAHDTLHAALRVVLHRNVDLVTAASASVPLEAFLLHLPDAVVAELPSGGEGWLSHELRSLHAATSCPLVVVVPDETTAETTTRWADHVLVAPVPSDELGAAISEVLARSSPPSTLTDSGPAAHSIDVAATGNRSRLPSAHEVLRAGPFRIDEAGHRAHCDGRELALTRTEFELLTLFVLHPHQVLTRDLILERVWGGWVGDDHLVDVHLSRLRRKILAVSGTHAFPAVRGVGFRLLELTAS
jgi:DNA-binding response OmpR family regulator